MRLFWLLLLCAITASCAKFPDQGGGPQNKRVVFTFDVSGEINPNYVYIVAITASKDAVPTVDGPVPVIREPWGNGFVAGTVDLFVRWDPLASPEFIIYRFVDQNLINFQAVGTPVSVEDVVAGTKRIRFELDLSQIAAQPQDLPDLKTLLVNVLTMNRVPQGTDPGTKNWDSLGDSRLPSEVDDFVVIPLDEPGIYNNQRFNDMEPENDTPDPDLDIVDWSVEVRSQ